ncbi:hypothetical protein [Komagataeibacter oboediens]|uniref:hypothetical protein n=1 Tax=Komagataeibacter oboediens TaxID=65958 RepID=UPI001FD3FC07|nr:hypothetical protein [Komagataeibacter oboediens]
MELIIGTGTVVEASRDTMPATGTPGWATDGDPAATIPATDFPASHYNMLVAEVVQVILDAGLTLDRTNWGQLSAAIQKMIASPYGGTVFTPVQQGGGADQGGNKIYLGWESVDGASTGRLRYQIDSSDIGPIANYSDVTAETTRAKAEEAALQTQIDGCVPTPADNSDPVNGRVTEFLYNKSLQQFVAFCPSITAAGNGMSLIGSQTFGATGFSSLSNFVYRESDGALQANVGSISAAVIVDFAPVSSVDTVQANLTTEQTARTNADATLQTQIDGRVITPADNSDATNGNIDTLIYNKTLEQPVAFNNGTGYALPFSQTYGAAGFVSIANMVMNTSTGGLTINYGNMSDGTTHTYLPASQGTIAGNGNLQGGTWTKTGNQLRQCFQQLAWDGCTIDYPAGDYATTPTVTFIAASSADGNHLSVPPCFNTLPTTTSFSPHLATFAGSTDGTIPENNPVMLHIVVEGTAA